MKLLLAFIAGMICLNASAQLDSAVYYNRKGGKVKGVQGAYFYRIYEDVSDEQTTRPYKEFYVETGFRKTEGQMLQGKEGKNVGLKLTYFKNQVLQSK